jgi:uncharacterized delta-60 repeat protein
MITSFTFKISGVAAYTDGTSGPFESTYSNGIISNPFELESNINFSQLYTDEPGDVDALQDLLTLGSPGGKYLNFVVTSPVQDKTISDWWMDISGIVTNNDESSGAYCVQYRNGNFNDVFGKVNFHVILADGDASGIIVNVLQSVSTASTVAVANLAPTDTSISSASIAEYNAIGDVIGTFSTVDPDAGDTFTYALVTGTGDTDNALFTIDGADLLADEVFDYNTRNSYSIRVRSTDQGGMSFEKVFIMSIVDLPGIIAGGLFIVYNGVTKNRLVKLNPNGNVDGTFGIGTGFNSSVYSSIVQSDGKIIFGGLFTTYDGTTQTRITRLNSNGTRDTGFTAPTFNNPTGGGLGGRVRSFAIQSDGKIVVGGAFNAFGGPQNRIARLNSNGTLDTGFTAGFAGGSPDIVVNSLAIQSDGKIIAGGAFTTTTVGGSQLTQNRIVRFLTNGTRDNTFVVGTGFSSSVLALVIQSDGKILVGGAFTSYNGTGQNRITRLNSDGTRDTGFTIGTGFNNDVNAIVIQSDGKILVGGSFTDYNGTTQNRIARLNSDGTLDSAFTIGSGFDLAVNSLVIQSDGKIVVGGAFGSYNGITANFICRLNSNGALDTGFTTGTGFDSAVTTVILA